MKIVVFDLDETLGYFVEMGIFWDILTQSLKESSISYSLTQEDFHSLLDLYPEFLRPNILTLLKYLIHKKKSQCCHKIMIYTNNQGPVEWCKQLISYFEYKVNFHLFDQIINAFKTLRILHLQEILSGTSKKIQRVSTAVRATTVRVSLRVRVRQYW